MAAMQETARINDSKEGLAEKENIESPTKLTAEDHDAPLTEEDIAFVQDFAQSPEKSRLMRKIDFRILPILILLYLISFIGEPMFDTVTLLFLGRHDLNTTIQIAAILEMRESKV